ncbi:MAG: hypothetical protein ACKKMW_01205 [Candidatus Nealsonbacteria bacterium]
MNNVKIQYENKPNKELIKEHCKKLEKLLSAHNLSVSIELFNTPARLERYVNGKLTGIQNLWIKKISIKSPEFGELPVRLTEVGLDENPHDSKMWTNAWHIQDQIYHQLNLVPSSHENPNWKNDPYWKLWNHLER